MDRRSCPFSLRPATPRLSPAPYASSVGRILPFQVLSAAGSSLARGLQDNAVVVVNPRTSEELPLSKEEVRHIRERGLTAG
jgi:hypothetical protein